MAVATRREEPNAVHLAPEQEYALLQGGIEPITRDPETLRSGAGDEQIETTRTRPAKLWMYSPEGIRKAIPGQDASSAWEAGYRFDCPKCGTKCEGVLRSCPAIEQPKWMRCPIATCGKIMRDHQFGDVLRPGNDEQPAGEEITFQVTNTPEIRLRERLRRHMLARHPSESPMYGFTPDRPQPERGG